MQQRSMLKRNNPGKWSSTNGLKGVGENSIDTCIRETKEELGIDVPIDKVKYIGNKVADKNLVVDIFITLIDVDIKDIVIDKEEVNDVRYVLPDELVTMDISSTCEYIRNDIKTFLKIIDKEKHINYKK